MYVLDTQRQIIAVSSLCEGMGIRAAGRVTGAHRDTIMRLGRNVGEGYARLHDELFVNLTPQFIEVDEAWSFVFKKQARLRPGDHHTHGDQYSYIAMDADRKGIISYLVGKRTNVTTFGFALDLRHRVVGDPQITSDGSGSLAAGRSAATASSGRVDGPRSPPRPSSAWPPGAGTTVATTGARRP